MNLIEALRMFAYGTSEGVSKAWDTRGRGRNVAVSYKTGRKPIFGYRTLNGVKMTPAATPDYSGIDHDLQEPELVARNGKWLSAGVIVVEKDGRFWMVSPRENFGGYRTMFPKGSIDKDESAQHAALRELWEETGLTAKITGVLGDFERTNSVTRYFVGERTGGAPWAPGDKEMSSVKLMPADMPSVWQPLLNTSGRVTSDHYVAAELFRKLNAK